MNKLVTGAIAAAAGITLVAGGAGTLALWNQTATLSAPSITAGSLSLVANSDGVWKNGSTTITPSSYRIVPGTTLTYTQTLTVNAVGDGLKADLTFSGLTGSNGLNAYVTLSPLSVTSSTATDVSAAHDGSTLEFTAGTSTVNVSVSVTFQSASDNTSMTKVLDLSQASFTLTQV